MWLLLFLFLLCILIVTREPYSMDDDHTEWERFFASVDDDEAGDVVDEWKYCVEYNEIDMSTIRDLIDSDSVGDIPDLFPDCKYRHLLATHLITFNS